MASGTKARSGLAGRALLVAVAITIVAAPLSISRAGTAGASGSPSAPAIQLLAETSVVDDGTTALDLAVSDTGPARGAHADVHLTLYSRLTTLSGLEAAIGPVGPSFAVATTRGISAGCLASGGELRLAVAVSPNGARAATRPLCGGVTPVLRFGCDVACDGVYPLRITVRSATGVSSLVTLVTYAAPSESPLRVAWVLRVAGRANGLPHAIAALAGVASHPAVPLSVDVEGSTVLDALTTHAPGTAHAVSLLAAAVSVRAHELVDEPFVDANMGALYASGLGTELTRQYALDEVALKLAGIQTAPSRTVAVATGPQTPTMATADASVGVDRLIVDGDALQANPADTLSWGAPFTLAGTTAPVVALSNDDDLASISDGAGTDPGLSAAQFLGELAFLHFEQPDLPDARVVTVVTTLTRDVPTAFVDAVLRGLASSPVLAPVTASEAFDDVPIGANGFPSQRALVLGASSAFTTTTVDMIKFLRITTDGLSSAVTAGATPIPSIEGQLLAAERVMPAARRLTLLDRVHVRLEDELGYFHVDDGSITLTGSGASLPITVLSSAPYTVRGVLHLSSPRIAFPDGASRSVTMSASVRSVRIPAQAQTTGDIPLTVTFTTPDGRVVLARAAIIVRSTPTSVVGIALTVGAVLVLALWWIRTARRKAVAR